jgi:hypothetical protein
MSTSPRFSHVEPLCVDRIVTHNEELETLNAQARELEQTTARNVAEILSL